MAKKIIVNVIPEEIRMALVEEGALLEVAVERTESNHMVGNIYKGRVENVLPGMQAAFINIGIGKNAFLYAGDIFPHKSFSRLVEEDNLTVGAEIMIEIVKDAMGTKGPRATTHFSIPGRYVVVMPSVDYVGISRRIESAEERSRLRKLAEKIRPKGMGVIVRTVAEGHTEEELARDFQYLANLWEALTVKAKKAKAPFLLYRDADLTVRIIRDHVKDDIDEVIIDNVDVHSRMVELARFISPDLVKKIHLYKGKTEIFTHHGVEDEWSSLADRRVDLKCGGYLIIDKTEALTVIDVNTGRFIGHSNLADTVFRTNMEATAEIARQLRLRDIGGIIVADFIDMQKDAHKKAVLIELEARLKADNTKTNVLGLTELGLVEMTRKKARQTYEGTLYESCPCCSGRGTVQTTETLVIAIRRQLRRVSLKRPGSQLAIQMHPRIAENFGDKQSLLELEQELGIDLTIEPMSGMQPEVYSIMEGKKALVRSSEPKKTRRISSRSVAESVCDQDLGLAELLPEDLSPLLAEKFAMEVTADPSDTLEARLTAMSSCLWEPLIEEEDDELEAVETKLVEADQGQPEAVAMDKKPRRRRRSNKMTLAEATGLTVAEQPMEPVLLEETEVADVLVSGGQGSQEENEETQPNQKVKRRRKPRKKNDSKNEVEKVGELSFEAVADSKSTDNSVNKDELIELETEPEAEPDETVKKTKRRRRRKKKTVNGENAEGQSETQPELEIEQVEPVESAGTEIDLVAEVKKSKRRRRKKKKTPVEAEAESLLVDENDRQPDEPSDSEPENSALSALAESGEAIVKKSKRRRRKKKTNGTNLEEPAELAEPVSLSKESTEQEKDQLSIVEAEAGDEVAVKKKRRRRRSSSKKKLVEGDASLSKESEPAD